MIPFLKMHGLGNDFVVIDNRKENVSVLAWAKIADRHFGIGCDQVVLLEKSGNATVFMRIFNADGSEVKSCGNASRCIAWLMHKENPTHTSVSIETLAGVIEAYVNGDAITIDMGEPLLEWEEIPLAQKSDTLHLSIKNDTLSDPVAVNMGNPHMVFFVPDINAVPLHTLGPVLEKHPLFPERANVGIAQVISKGRIMLRVWERGAGLTMACGTGACAAVVAAHLRGLTARDIQVQLPGGTLFIDWRKSDNHVLMTGPATVSFQGEFDAQEYSV